MKGIIINWIDTLASIPADWLLCDGNNSTPNLLGKYPLGAGAGEDPGATGGSATHTHTSPAHNHTQDTHSHTGTSGAGGSNVYNSLTDNPNVSHATAGHQHGYTTSSTVATNQTTAITTNTASNDPAYYKVAPIIDNSIAGVKYPASSLIFWGQATLPLGWSACDGSGGTPDLRNKFLKCVDAAENPGATGGSATHTHTPNSHNHTQDSHSHTGTTGGTNSSGSHTASNVCGIAPTHTHAISVNSITITNQASNVTLDTINAEPTFKKLLIIKNTGIANRPKYAIVEWTGTIANIPLGYVLCDGTNGTPDMRDYFVKGANDSSELGNTGGSSVHNHTASPHNHTQDSHTHTVSGDASTGGAVVYGFGSGITVPSTEHSHSGASSNSTTATNQSTTITISNCSSQANYPPYYKVAYIMQDRDLDVGAYAFMVN